MVSKEERQQVIQNIQGLIDKYINARDGRACDVMFLFASLRNVLWVGDDKDEKHSDIEYFKRLRDLIDIDSEEALTTDSEEAPAPTPDEPTKIFRLPTDEDAPKLSNAGHAVSITITIGESPTISSMAAVPNNEKQQIVQNLQKAIQDCLKPPSSMCGLESCVIDGAMAFFDRPLWVGRDSRKTHTDAEYFARIIELISD